VPLLSDPVVQPRKTAAEPGTHEIESDSYSACERQSATEIPQLFCGRSTSIQPNSNALAKNAFEILPSPVAKAASRNRGGIVQQCGHPRIRASPPRFQAPIGM
jgi:hypothetical protein